MRHDDNQMSRFLPEEPPNTANVPASGLEQTQRGQEHAVQARRREREAYPVRGRLVFGIDIDGTISQAPEHFGRVIQAIHRSGERVVIITARGEDRREETEAFLRDLHIEYERLILRPVDWPGTVPEFKVKACLDERVDLFIDNEEPNCWAVLQQTPALALFMLPIPETQEKSSKFQV